MEAVYLIILLAVLAGVVWWRLNARKSAAARGSSADRAAGQAERPGADRSTRADGALSGGSAAASAEAAGTTGIASAAGFGRPAEPPAPTTANEPAESVARPDVATPKTQHSSTGSSAVGAAGAGSGEGVKDERRIQDAAEWETQWSEASGSAPGQESASRREGTASQAGAAPSVAMDEGASDSQPVHHAEYTAPQAPTLPGAETAAVEEPEDTGTATAAPQPSPAGTERTENTEDTENSENTANSDVPPSPRGAGIGLPADAGATETQDRAQSSALVETGADHTQEPPAMPVAGTGPAGTEPAAPEPTGHLAADEPYGAGSASATADGSGPADYTVKGDAGAMVYYEEGHPEYEQTRADVWFESPAHAEAAGFRAPRRRRI